MRKSHTQCENHANNAYVLAFPLSWLTPLSEGVVSVEYGGDMPPRNRQHDGLVAQSTSQTASSAKNTFARFGLHQSSVDDQHQ